MTDYQAQWKGKALKTPAGQLLSLPTAALATAIEAEWASLSKLPTVSQIPLTQIANTAQDRIAADRAAAEAAWLQHIDADLLFYLAVEPDDLIEREKTAWRPLWRWAEDVLGTAPQIQTGIKFAAQTKVFHTAMVAEVQKLDVYRLTLLGLAGGLLGSCVLSLAFVVGRLDAAEALRLAEVDERYQSELWGEPEELLEQRASRASDMADLGTFLGLL